MGWGRGAKRPKWHRVGTLPERCGEDANCSRPPTYGCVSLYAGVGVCEVHKSSCCLPFKVSTYRSPLQKLGSWMFANKRRIDGAPEDLLLDAFRHVEIRMINCRHGNARARATERWLGRWAKLIDRELEVQRHLAAYERDNFGVVGPVC